VDGTPSDCVHLGLLNFFKERPQMVISGINLGLNVADNIFYSGTVAAAMEGLLHGLPAMAVSRKAWKPGDPSLQQATAITVRLAQWWIEQREWHGKCVLNVNFPPGKPRGLRFARLGQRQEHNPGVQERDPLGRNYFWAWASVNGFTPDDEADFQMVDDGFVSLTPLRVERTWNDALTALAAVQLPQLD